MRVVARIVVRSGGEGLLFLRSGRYLLGRGNNCDLILDNREASRRHAVIELDETSAAVIDQGSRNGTYVNYRPANRSLLENGSVVQIGTATCVFEWLDRAAFDDEPTPSQHCVPSDSEQSLTPAERRVLAFLIGGLAEKAIAAKLSVSRHTVHNHVKRIYVAYGVNSRSELLARFIHGRERI